MLVPVNPFFAAVTALTLAGLIGCGSSGPATHPVSGVVTLGGQPIESATVTFHPAGGEGRSASGTTDASGQYELTTFASGDGAMAGSYRVTIAKYETPDGVVAEADDEGETLGEVSEEEFEDVYEEVIDEENPPAENVLPEQYANPTNSGFEAKVVAGENSHDFDLQ